MMSGKRNPALNAVPSAKPFGTEDLRTEAQPEMTKQTQGRQKPASPISSPPNRDFLDELEQLLDQEMTAEKAQTNPRSKYPDSAA